MTQEELIKMIEEEVSDVIREPIREPEIARKKPQYHPVLKTEDDIDDMLFYTGNVPEEIQSRRKKTNKKITL